MRQQKLTNTKQSCALTTTQETRFIALRTGVKSFNVSTAKRSLFCLLVVASILSGVALSAFIALHIRLGQGPIQVDYLVDPIEQSINRELNGVRLDIAGAILRYPEAGYGLQFRLRDVRLINDQGAVVARAPMAAIDLSSTALLRGRIAPTQVDFIQPRILSFYNETRGLAVSFSRHARKSPGGGLAGDDQTAQLVSDAPGSQQTKQSINLASTLATALSSLRRRNVTGSYLKKFGVQDAVVILEQDGQQTHWNVASFTIALLHRKKRSWIKGEGQILSAEGPWQVQFSAEESEKRQSLKLSLDIFGLVPRVIASALPRLSFLDTLNMPVSIKALTEFSSSGDMKFIELAIALSSGDIGFGEDAEPLITLRDGTLNLRYVRADDRVEILPSRLRSQDGEVTISGYAVAHVHDNGQRTWRFDVKGTDAQIVGADKVGIEKVEAVGARGEFNTEEKWMQLDAFQLLLKEGNVNVAGRLSPRTGMTFNGQVARLSTESLKRIWPPMLAPNARTWFSERVSGGRIQEGYVAVSLPWDFVSRIEQGEDIPSEAVTLVFKGSGQSITYHPEMPPAVVDEATASLMGRQFLFEARGSAMQLPSGTQLAFRDVRFEIPDLRQNIPEGRLKIKASTSVAALYEYLRLEPFSFASQTDAIAKKLSGKASVDLGLAFPLISTLERRHVQASGRARVEELSANDLVGGIDVDGGTIVLEITQHAIEARGDVLLNGVAAELRWLRFLGTVSEKQPPLRLRARLDESDREQLGLFVNHFVNGPSVVDLMISKNKAAETEIKVQVDLANAEILVDNLAWRKPPGQNAVMRFDIKSMPDGSTELRNFKVVGKEIAIDGWVSLGSDNRVRAFKFPEFSLNVVSQLELSGKLGNDDVWQIKAKGRSYDGRAFFRSLFSAEKLGTSNLPPSKRRAGLDIEAQIATVIGFSDASMRNLEMAIKRRGGVLTAFSASASLDSGAPIGVRLANNESDVRYLLAETKDAGRAFRLVGFYSKIEGGEASLRVNLDGRGAADKTGVLWTRDFVVLGDPVVQEVLSDVPGSRGKGTGRYKKQHLRFKFDQMRVPFSVGYGQFVLHDSYINGPALGATMRGKVDVLRQVVQLGGTYVPLYGLNAAFGAFPIIGDLLVGRRGEGVLGITFAVSGSLSDPQVIVNPISAVAPGIFRQIFEFYQAPLKVDPRQAPVSTGPRPEASSTPPILMPEAVNRDGWQARQEKVGGWSIENLR